MGWRHREAPLPAPDERAGSPHLRPRAPPPVEVRGADEAPIRLRCRMPPSALSNYRGRMARTAAGIEALRTLALDAGLHADAQALLLEVDRLREATFRIVVIGEFSRGKSTLINALLGRAVLPARLRPTTSTLLRIRHGKQDAAWVTQADGTVAPWELSRINEVSSVTGSAAGGVREVTIELDAPLLANGVELIDTPGVNDLSTLREDITLSYLPAADAAIFVLDAKACFTETERKFLTQHVLNRNLGRVFFVVNKADQLNPPYNADDLQRLRERVTTLLRPYLPDPRVFLLAAKPALDGALSGDDQKRAESGVPHFIGALGTFLAEERGSTRVERALRVAAARHDGVVSGLELRSALLRERREVAATRIGEHREGADRAAVELERLRKGWNQRVEAEIVPVRAAVVEHAARIQRAVAAASTLGDAGRQLQQAFIELTERAMVQLRTGILASARAASANGENFAPGVGGQPVVTASAADHLVPIVPQTAFLTPASTLTAAGVMGVAALLGLFSPGVIVFAGVMAFLHTRTREEAAEKPAQLRSVELQARVQEAARRVLARLDEEAGSLAETAWRELAQTAIARHDNERGALAAAEADLSRTDDDRERETKGLAILRLRLDATMRDLVDGAARE